MQFLVGDDASEAVVSTISPVNYVTADFPPTMLLTGNRDDTVDWRDSQVMYQRLIDSGARAELHVFEGAPHAFDAVPAFGRQCAGLMALFLDRHVRDPQPIAVTR
jgi:acetyl esterase/lipase